MSPLATTGVAVLVLFAGVSLFALFTRRIGNSRKDAGALILTGMVLVIGFLSMIFFIDRLGLNAGQREWALRIGFVGLTLALWRTSNRLLGKSFR